MQSILSKIGLQNRVLKTLSKTYRVKKIALFGSYINGSSNQHSDIDFLVEFEKGADLMNQAGLKIELEELLHRKVDVVTPGALSKYFRSKVLNEVIYL